MFDMWSKYVIFVYLFTYFKYVDCFAVHAYFHANFEYANTLRKHMRRGYIGACPPCIILLRVMFTDLILVAHH